MCEFNPTLDLLLRLPRSSVESGRVKLVSETRSDTRIHSTVREGLLVAGYATNCRATDLDERRELVAAILTLPEPALFFLVVGELSPLFEEGGPV